MPNRLCQIFLGENAHGWACGKTALVHCVSFFSVRFADFSFYWINKSEMYFLNVIYNFNSRKSISFTVSLAESRRDSCTRSLSMRFALDRLIVCDFLSFSHLYFFRFHLLAEGLSLIFIYRIDFGQILPPSARSCERVEVKIAIMNTKPLQTVIVHEIEKQTAIYSWLLFRQWAWLNSSKCSFLWTTSIIISFDCMQKSIKALGIRCESAIGNCDFVVFAVLFWVLVPPCDWFASVTMHRSTSHQLSFRNLLTLKWIQFFYGHRKTTHSFDFFSRK